MLSDLTGPPGSRLALSVRICCAIMHFRSLCIGFRFPNDVATCICSYAAESLQEGANFLTAHRIPCVRFVWVVRLCVSPSQSRNTQYGWLAMPLPMRTFTSSENVKLRLAHQEIAFFLRVTVIKNEEICKFFLVFSAKLKIKGKRKGRLFLFDKSLLMGDPTSSQTSAVSSLVALHLSSQDFLSNPFLCPNFFSCMSDTLLSTSIAPYSLCPFTSTNISFLPCFSIQYLLPFSLKEE